MTLTIIIILFLGPTIWAWTSLAPWVPTDKKDIPRLNAAANLQPGDVFVEMGSGDGRVSRYIAKQNPQAQVIGIELNIYSYFFSKIRSVVLGPKNFSIQFGDALKYDISNVNVLYTFALTQTVNREIKKKLLRDMQPGTKFLSYAFAIDEWKGREVRHEQKGSSTIYEYTK